MVLSEVSRLQPQAGPSLLLPSPPGGRPVPSQPCSWPHSGCEWPFLEVGTCWQHLGVLPPFSLGIPLIWLPTQDLLCSVAFGHVDIFLRSSCCPHFSENRKFHGFPFSPLFVPCGLRREEEGRFRSRLAPCPCRKQKSIFSPS